MREFTVGFTQADTMSSDYSSDSVWVMFKKVFSEATPQSP